MHLCFLLSEEFTYIVICFGNSTHAIDTPTEVDGSVRSADMVETPVGDGVLDKSTDDDASVLVELDMKLTQEQWGTIEDRYRKQFS